ncbi:hypothetical protein MTO96_051139 [Rhipicephalus appendiculatus]
MPAAKVAIILMFALIIMVENSYSVVLRPMGLHQPSRHLPLVLRLAINHLVGRRHPSCENLPCDRPGDAVCGAACDCRPFADTFICIPSYGNGRIHRVG